MRKNWKTSLAGIVGGLLIAVGPQVGARLQGSPGAPPITLNSVITGAAVAALGLGAKDGDVTGGSRHQ